MDKNLLKIATLGTKRATYQSEAELFGELPEKELQEEQLLRDAAFYTFAKKVGFLPKETKVQFISAALPEEKEVLEEKAIYYFENAANDFLLREFIERTASINKIFPPKSLPYLLDLTISRKWKPDDIINIAGERGKWLVQFKKEWKLYFGEATEKEWETGTIEQRIRYLREIRKTNPVLARQLFGEVLAQESLPNLVKLLSVFAENSSKEDEPILEKLLKHNRKEVRTKSFQYLIPIEGSAFAQRMQSYCLPFVNAERKGMGSLNLMVKLPQKMTKEMELDGIADSVKIHGLGIKATRLVQLLQCIAPTFWEKELEATPEELVKAAEKNTYNQALFQAWASATIFHENADWAVSLLESMVKETKRYEMVTDHARRLLIRLVTPGKMNELIALKFKGTKHLQSTNLGFRLMVDYDRQISLENSVQFFKLLKNSFKDKATTERYVPIPEAIFSEFKKMVHLFPVEVLPIVENYWKETDIADIYLGPISDLMAQIEFKSKMYEAI